MGRKGKKKGGAKTAQALAPLKDDESSEARRGWEREEQLRRQLMQIGGEISVHKEKVNLLRNRNEWLKAQVDTCRTDGRDYVSYLAAKSKKKEAMIESLEAETVLRREQIIGKHNAIEQGYIKRREECTEEIAAYMKKTKSKEAEISNMQHVAEQRSRQQREVVELQKMLVTIKEQNEKDVEAIRSKALHEKIEFQREMENQLQALEEQVNRVAEKCMREFEVKQRKENETLRIRLAELLSQTKQLEVNKQRLLERTKHQQENKEMDELVKRKQTERIRAALEKQGRRLERSQCE